MSSNIEYLEARLDWISASKAFELVSAAVGKEHAARAILRRAMFGIVAAKAARLVDAGVLRLDSPINPSFWSSEGEHLIQDWVIGDFSGWQDDQDRNIWQTNCFGVQFRKVDIFEMLGMSSSSAATAKYRTGAQGRPSAKHLALVEHTRRFENNLSKRRVCDEAQELFAWLLTTHPDAPTITSKSMENIIREQHRLFFPH